MSSEITPFDASIAGGDAGAVERTGAMGDVQRDTLMNRLHHRLSGRYWIVIILAVILGSSGGYIGYTKLHPRIVTEGVEEFCTRSKQAVDGLSLNLGDWVGERRPRLDDTPARRLFKPNAESTISYRNPRKNAEVLVAVVQVRDCRDMIDLTPSVYYPGNGWRITRQTPHTWRVGEFEIPGIEYLVDRTTPQGQNYVLTVQDFYVFPNGQFGATEGEINRAASDYRRVAYGTTQVQVVTEASMNENVRQEIWQELVGSKQCLEMIRVLRSGIPHEQ